MFYIISKNTKFVKINSQKVQKIGIIKRDDAT